MKKTFIFLCILAILCIDRAFAGQTLTLSESKQFALQNNCKIQNSQLEIDAAHQKKKAVFTKYFPAINASGAMFDAQDNLLNLNANVLGMSFPLGFFKNGTLGMVSAVQPVFAGGRIWYGNQLASLGEEASRDKGRLSQNEVLLKTEEQYWRVVSVYEKLNTIQKYEDFLNRLLLQAEDAYNAGIVLKNDLLKVKVKRSEVLLLKSKAENGKTIATMAFCQYVGVPYDASLTLKDLLSAADPPQTYYVDHAAALENRAEYKLLKASVRAEELQTKMKRGEYLPQAGVGAAKLYMKIDEMEDETTEMIFGTLSIPISGWWEASHELSELKIKEKIARNNFKNNSELLLLQMQKAWQDLNDSYKQVLLSEEAKKQAEENLRLNQDSFDNGLSGMTDLLEAMAMLQQINDQLTDAKASYRNQLVLYLQVTGR